MFISIYDSHYTLEEQHTLDDEEAFDDFLLPLSRRVAASVDIDEEAFETCKSQIFTRIKCFSCALSRSNLKGEISSSLYVLMWIFGN